MELGRYARAATDRAPDRCGRSETSRAGQAYAESTRADRCRGSMLSWKTCPHGWPRADLVLCRSGATTLAELTCAAGRAAMLVPYPFAADDHQWHNAEALEQAPVQPRSCGIAELNGRRICRRFVAGLGPPIANGLRDNGPRRARTRPDPMRRTAICRYRRGAAGLGCFEGVAPMFRKARRLHFVGVGGTGMSGIAEVLVNLGYSGIRFGPGGQRAGRRERFEETGSRPYTCGHRAGACARRRRRGHLLCGTAKTNPEVDRSACALMIPVIPRAEMLAELMRHEIRRRRGRSPTARRRPPRMVAEVLTRARRAGSRRSSSAAGSASLRSGAQAGSAAS